MNIENLKSVLLINLVVISLFLTFNLWTYVPDSSKLQNAKYLQNNEEIEEKNLMNVLSPSVVLFHKENTHLGNQSIESIDPLYKLLERGELYDFRDKSDVLKQQFFSFIRGKNKIEMIFPTHISLDSMRGVFTLKEKISDSYSFNRILIDIQGSREGYIPIYFISYENRKVYEMTLKGVSLKELEGARDQFVAKARDYSQYTLSDTREIFLPDAKTNIKKMGYMTAKINEDTFINALFTDPRYVKKITSEEENTYIDGIRQMKVLKKKQMLEYTNSAVSNQANIYGSSLIQRSFNFINGHGDLTDSYRFDYMNSKKRKITYRLYVDSLPVFNDGGMATLEQVWGAEELISYKRPLFKLATSWSDEIISLSDGKTVIQSLERNEKIDMKLIQDIRLGYKLIPQSGTDGEFVKSVNLVPIWYVVYGEDNKILEWSEEKGGELIGLE